MDDPETTQYGQKVAVGEVDRCGQSRHATRYRTGVEAERAHTIRGMEQDLGTRRSADVIGMRVSHDKAADLARRAADRGDPRVQARERPAHAGVDHGDLVFQNDVSGRADERYAVDASGYLST